MSEKRRYRDTFQNTVVLPPDASVGEQQKFSRILDRALACDFAEAAVLGSLKGIALAIAGRQDVNTLPDGGHIITMALAYQADHQAFEAKQANLRDLIILTYGENMYAYFLRDL